MNILTVKKQYTINWGYSNLYSTSKRFKYYQLNLYI